MRLKLMQKYKLDTDFELSQSYLFFWDKLERANYFLESMIELADEAVDSRIVQYLLTHPVMDGGQYDMIINLVNKYGLVPKSAFPESESSGASATLNWLITYKLREFAQKLRDMHAKGKSAAELRQWKQERMHDIYSILTVHLGHPPQAFDWSFRSKDKKEFTRISDLTPHSFAAQYVNFQVNDQVSLINDPRNKYYALYTVAYLGNIVGGRNVRYINVPIDVLKSVTRKSLEAGQPVWFGCDVGKYLHREDGVMDTEYFLYEDVYGVQFGMSKADRLRYKESLMTHAMVFTGVDVRDDRAVKWRVENSWGDKHGDKGYYLMTDRWFDEYMYQIVVDKTLVASDVLDVLKQEPVVLPAWDPMGSLA